MTGTTDTNGAVAGFTISVIAHVAAAGRDRLPAGIGQPPVGNSAAVRVRDTLTETARIAERLGVAPGAVEIVVGHSAATKELSIAGMDDDTLKRAIP